LARSRRRVEEALTLDPGFDAARALKIRIDASGG
jgi:hypothetical protein